MVCLVHGDTFSYIASVSDSVVGLPDIQFRDEAFPDFTLRRWHDGHVFGEVVSGELVFASDFVLVHVTRRACYNVEK